MATSPPPPDDEAGRRAAVACGGGWIGIDLGTSNCAAAVWDLSRSRPKVVRVGLRDGGGGGKGKGGKVVPSAVLFRDDADGEAEGHDDAEEGGRAGDTGEVDVRRVVPGLSCLVGRAALRSLDVDDAGGRRPAPAGALVTSFKRVLGMTPRQAEELRASDPDFWNSLPFEAMIVENDGNGNGDAEVEESERRSPPGGGDDGCFDAFGVGDVARNIEHQNSSEQSQAGEESKEGVGIRIRTSNSKDPAKTGDRLVAPLQVATILLRAIREAATDCLVNNNKSKIRAPGMERQRSTASRTTSRGTPQTTSPTAAQTIPNCVIGVPAHYSHAQRAAVRRAARDAGFAGHVETMTESTAAAVAYGLFVSPSAAAGAEGNGRAPTDGTKGGEKNVLVFDMGGGTTDVTIAALRFRDESDAVQFRVVATAGDRRLGGDDVDESLARYLWERSSTAGALSTSSSSSSSSTTTLTGDRTWKAMDHPEFLRQCRRAKEELCGSDDEKDGHHAGVDETTVTLRDETINITRPEFDSAILPIVDRAERVVADALSAMDLETREQSRFIHEVVLVGGSTRIPAVRAMLRRRFPPPVPPELCTSVPAETAVAQGLAMRAALASGTVPLWEMRNAAMLDALPHSIGVWVSRVGVGGDGGGSDGGSPYAKGEMMRPDDGGTRGGHFVPILVKDAPLPAAGSAPFALAAVDQSGITVVAAERVGPGEVYQCMGVFDFLLHRPDGDVCGAREVEVGMRLEPSGEFRVSVFDECDPEHREKRRRYQREKSQPDGDPGAIGNEVEGYYEEEEERHTCTGTEIGLVIFCVILFSLYVAARVAFHDVEVFGGNDEL